MEVMKQTIPSSSLFGRPVDASSPAPNAFQMTNWLPNDEAAQLRSELESGLARLGISPPWPVSSGKYGGDARRNCNFIVYWFDVPWAKPVFMKWRKSR
jgi:hypothetical protein